MNPVLIGVASVVVVFLGWATWKAPRLTSILWWTFLAAVLGSSAIIVALPGAFTERVFWVAILTPVVWVALQFWCYWDGKKSRVALSMIGICVFSGAVVMVSGSPISQKPETEVSDGES
ncbi:MAG: hypothetical protein AAGD96_30175 [Chloroflexota bacterium]